MTNTAINMSHVESIHDSISGQYCWFRVGDNLYTVSVLDVQEVIRPQKMTVVPQASECIRGLINLRGQIVTAISLRKMFGLEEDLSRPHMNMIIRDNGHLISLVVDEIYDVIDLNSKDYGPTPSTVAANLQKYMKGVFKLEDKLLIHVNIKEILGIKL